MYFAGKPLLHHCLFSFITLEVSNPSACHDRVIMDGIPWGIFSFCFECAYAMATKSNSERECNIVYTKFRFLIRTDQDGID